jgi:type II secretory pathway pseudopilin PulG
VAAFSLVELVFALGLAATLSAVAVPHLLASLDEARAASAARYVSTRLQRTRMEAIARNEATAVRVTRAAESYRLTQYVDGNRNGVRSRDIEAGVDRLIAGPERLGDQFPGVDFGVVPGLPPIDIPSGAPGADPIRLGSSDLVTFSPLGTATPGSLYVLGRRNVQFVVRIFGETGKTRILKFNQGSRQWIALSGV